MFIEFLTNVSQPEQLLVGTGSESGMIVYLIIFLLVFLETGIVIAAPFCPGDTLLIICGILIGTGFLDPALVLLVISLAAISGDTLNYQIGRYAGAAFLTGPAAGWIKPEWILKTHAYFSRFGGFTIVIGRYIPYLRSLAPFMAGVGSMNYGTFLIYNMTGGVLWTCTVVGAGYFLGRTLLESGYAEHAGWMILISAVIGVLFALYVIIVLIRHRLSMRR